MHSELLLLHLKQKIYICVFQQAYYKEKSIHINHLRDVFDRYLITLIILKKNQWPQLCDTRSPKNFLPSDYQLYPNIY